MRNILKHFDYHKKWSTCADYLQEQNYGNLFKVGSVESVSNVTWILIQCCGAHTAGDYIWTRGRTTGVFQIQFILLLKESVKSVTLSFKNHLWLSVFLDVWNDHCIHRSWKLYIMKISYFQIKVGLLKKVIMWIKVRVLHSYGSTYLKTAIA